METSLAVISVFTGIIALCNLVLLIGLAALALAVKRLLDKSVRPVIDEVSDTVRHVSGVVQHVSDSVAATNDVVQHTVAQPFIAIAGLAAGVGRAIETIMRRG